MIHVAFIPLHHHLRPSSRYRVFQLLEPLEREGFKTSLVPAPERDPLKRLGYLPRLFPMALKADVLYIQKRTLPTAVLAVLKRLNSRIVFDFDDAIFLQPGNRARVDAVLRAARMVVAGNSFLAGYARRFNEHVTIIPSVVDTGQVCVPTGSRHPKDDRVVLGWIGSDPNRGDLEPLLPVFDGLADRYGEKIVLKTIGRRPLEMQTRLTLEHIPWELEKADSDLQGFDIGLMPLADTEWNHGKCGFKLVQYMAVGAANVASPVGVNPEIVLDGQTGFLAASPEDWQSKLARLIEDDSLRQAMGSQARQRVEESYSIKAILPALKQVLTTAAVTEKDHP